MQMPIAALIVKAAAACDEASPSSVERDEQPPANCDRRGNATATSNLETPAGERELLLELTAELSDGPAPACMSTFVNSSSSEDALYHQEKTQVLVDSVRQERRTNHSGKAKRVSFDEPPLKGQDSTVRASHNDRQTRMHFMG